MNYIPLLTSIIVTFICWLIFLPLINSLHLPITNSYGIVSRMVIDDRSPFTNYLIYLLLFVLPSLVFLGSIYLIDKKIPYSFLLQPITKLGLVADKIYKSKFFLPGLIFVVIACWITNVTQTTLTTTGLAYDGFHFGEKIGLSGAFLRDKKHFFEQEYMMIHGFALNVLPGIVGYTFGGNAKDIAYTLFTVYCENVLAIIFSFLVLIEIAAYISKQYKWTAFLFLVIVYISLNALLFVIQDRDAIFLLQTYLSIRWLRLTEKHSTKNYVLYPILIGLIFPLSICYVYDRAVLFFLPYLYLGIHFYFTKGNKYIIRSLGLTAIASLSSFIVLSMILGLKAFPLFISQILYWAKFGNIAWSLPYPEIKIFGAVVSNWVIILLHIVIFNTFLFNFRLYYSARKINKFLEEYGLTIFLFFCALSYMRVALGRSDGGHILSPGFFSLFCFIPVLVKQFKPISLSYGPLGAIALIICSSFINIGSVMAAGNFAAATRYPLSIDALLSKSNSELVSSSYWETANQIKPELNEQSCFYTLTSEGIWYNLLGLKPCSKYYYLVYSRTPESQNEIVQNLEASKPKLILYSNASLGNGIDGVAKETSHLLVHQYIWQQYRPYKRINENWFWIRRDSPLQLKNILVPLPNKILGSLDTLSTLESNNKLDIGVAGWASMAPTQISNHNTVLLTYNPQGSPQELIPIALSSATIDRPDVAKTLNNPGALHSGWQAAFNKLNIPSQVGEIKAWAYHASDDKFYQLPTNEPKLITGISQD